MAMGLTTGWIAGTLGVVIGSLELAAGVAAYRAGSVRVYVHEKRPGGEHVRIWVPAAVIAWGVRLVPDRELQRGLKDARPWLAVVRIASRELHRSPDGPLVQVESADEQVSITKRGDALVIDVNSRDETVNVSVPLNAAASLAEYLESLGPPA